MCFHFFALSQPTEESSKYTRVKLLFCMSNDTIKLEHSEDCIKSSDQRVTIRSYETSNNKIIKDVSAGFYGPGLDEHMFFRKNFLSYKNNKEKVGLKLIIGASGKKMSIDFNINKISPNNYLPWLINMTIYFKEGEFEITDPENPVLLPIKAKSKYRSD